MIPLALVTPEKPPDVPEAASRFLEENGSSIPTARDAPCLMIPFGGGGYLAVREPCRDVLPKHKGSAGQVSTWLF